MASSSDHSERIRCAFCNEDFCQGNDIKEHLMSCGNKTDPCPTCGKRIRRAVFTYHYENNCANTDELDNTTPRLPRKVRTERVTKPDCPYCKLEFEADTIEEHFRRCDKNPDREPARRIPATYTGNQHSDNARTEQRYNSSLYTTEFKFDTPPLVPKTLYFSCTYCGAKRDLESIATHERVCEHSTYHSPNATTVTRLYPTVEYKCDRCGTTRDNHDDFKLHQDCCRDRHRSASTHRTFVHCNVKPLLSRILPPWKP